MAGQILIERLLAEIRAGGPMRFSRLMEVALYAEDLGYYAAGNAGIGRGGDFYTSVSAGRAFAGIVCEQAAEAWERLGRPRPFLFLEQAAHDGTFARDFLGWAAEALPEFREALAYRIAEPFPALRGRQQEQLEGLPVRWIDSPACLEPHVGMHFANELLDALPFDRFVWEDGVWRELLVAAEEGRLVFRRGEETAPGLPTPPVSPFFTEVRRGLSALIRAQLTSLTSGFLLYADYGFPRSVRFDEAHRLGTAAAYRAHRRIDDLLEAPGLQDLTAHVDFTEVATVAEAAGVSLAGYADQHHFLVGAGERWLRAIEGAAPPTPDLRAFNYLIHPETMGRSFKFVAFAKACGGVPLSGFRFSSPESLRAPAS